MIVNAIGTPGATIMLIGEAPGEQENRTGKPFHPGTPTGNTLDKILNSAGISRHDCIITNVAKEKPPGNKIAFYFQDSKCTIPKDILLQDIEKLKQEIIKYKPNIVIPLGKIATNILTGNNNIAAARGYICESTLLPNLKVLPTYHPQQVNYEWKLFFTAVLDIRKAIKNSESPDMPKDKRVLTTNMSKLEYISYLKYLLYEHSGPIAVDIETLQPGSHIDIMGIADSATHGVAFELIKGRKPIYSKQKELEIWQHLALVLENKELIMQNGSYDTTVLYLHHGIHCPKFYYDTMVAAHVCWPENPRSLAYLASICLNVPAWKHTSQSESLLYNAGDTTNTFGVWNVLRKELVKQDVMSVFNHEMSQVEPSVMLQIQGLFVNKEKQKTLLKDIETELTSIQETLTAKLNREVIFKADKKKKDALNINSPTQLAELLYIDLKIPPQYKRRKRASEVRKVTTNEEALSKLARTINDPIFTDIIKVKKLSKLKSFIDITLSPADSVHTSYNVTGATMVRESKGFVRDEEDSFKSFGRWSSSKSIILPFGSGNLQNIPSRARTMYTAPDGYEFLQADYMQAEAVVVAYEINDYKSIALFEESFGLSKEERQKRELDIHKLTASTMFGIPIAEVTKELRMKGKIVKHSTNYNAGPGVIAHQLQIPMKEAKVLLSQASNATPQLGLWHKRIQQHLQKERSLTNLFGRKHRFLGRYNDSLLRSAYAFIPQSTVGDLLNMALVRFYNMYGKQRRIRLQLHDAIYTFSPIGKREETMKMLRDVMLIEMKSSNGVKYTIDVDFSAGPSWGEMKEV